MKHPLAHLLQSHTQAEKNKLVTNHFQGLSKKFKSFPDAISVPVAGEIPGSALPIESLTTSNTTATDSLDQTISEKANDLCRTIFQRHQMKPYKQEESCDVVGLCLVIHTFSNMS